MHRVGTGKMFWKLGRQSIIAVTLYQENFSVQWKMVVSRMVQSSKNLDQQDEFCEVRTWTIGTVWISKKVNPWHRNAIHSEIDYDLWTMCRGGSSILVRGGGVAWIFFQRHGLWGRCKAPCGSWISVILGVNLTI